MSNYEVLGDDAMFGRFLPGLQNFLAKVDPTSSKLGGQIVKGALSAAGTLVGIPPTLSFAGLTAVGKISGGIKSASKTAQQAGAQNVAPTVTVDPNAQYVNTPYASQYFSGQAPQQNYTPLIFAAGAGVIILAVVTLMKK